MNGPTTPASGASLTIQDVAPPRGGGATGGMGEQLDFDEFTGSASLSIPLASSDAREFSPDLALAYASAAGNGPFGLGFALSLPRISRRTRLGMPRYDADDVFELSGQGELVPLDGQTRTEHVGARTFTVVSYAPRLDESFDIIERWTASDGETLWRVVDRHNVTSLFGRDGLSRISDPRAPERVAAWLLDLQLDAEGKAVAVEYVAENTDGVPDAIYEVGREQTANRYPARIRFGNTVPFFAPPFGLGPAPATDWLLETVFDYGQYDPAPSNPTPYRPVRIWPARQDPFSVYVAGFEVRTHRLCRSVLTFHRFAELGPEPVLTHVVRLGYDESPAASYLVRVESVGYAPDPAPDATTPYRTAALPPLDFGYTPFLPLDQAFRPVVDEQDRPLAGLAQGPASNWVDIQAEGLPGVLYADGRTVLYRAPQSAGGEPVRLGPPTPLPDFPMPRTLASASVQLVDLDGDARLDLLVGDGGGAGVYRQREDGGWEPFHPLRSFPTELRASGAVLADLSSTGRNDLVVVMPQEIRTYRSLGEDGFGAPLVRPNEAGMVPFVPTTQVALETFADVLGAGSLQVVRVADGSVQCWPSLGYGVFASPVVLANPPRLGAGFDPARLFLSDINASGTADLLYVDGATLRIWFNESGNRFAEPVELPLPTTVTQPTQVRFADVAGVGAQSLLLSDILGTTTWSYTFVGQTKPDLLCTIDNNLGVRTTIGYKSSVAYRIEDERAGIPWLTFLPFPVQVVASVEHDDEVSRARAIVSYRYHHGYFDPVVRQFRGFGMVERRDAEQIEQASLSVEEAAFAVPPLLTKTWFHVGAWLGERRLEECYRREYFDGDPDALRVPPCAEIWEGPPPTDPEARREAAAALVGQVLHRESYGLDGAPNEAVPYTVVEQNYEVVMQQAPAGRRHGVYSVREREGVDLDYERQADDPVTTQHAVLEYDRFDNSTLSVTVAYPRRATVQDALPEQRVLHVHCDLAGYVNQGGSEPHFIGLPYEARSYELLGIPTPSAYFDVATLAETVGRALRGEGGASARLYDWRRYYYNAADGSEAPLGESGPQQLVRRHLEVFAEQTALRQTFASVLDAVELDALVVQAGRFVDEPGTGYWWRPSSVTSYATGADFFVPLEVTDALGARVVYRYDPYRLAILEATESGPDLREQRVLVDTFDYLKLVPTKVTDVNDNVSEVLLDPLGRVILTSRYGEEDGVRVGFAPLAGTTWPEPASLADFVERPTEFLGSAESRYYYDLLAWTGPDPQPGCSSRLLAQEYPGLEAPPPWVAVEYVDGFGRPLEQKFEAEPAGQGGPRRWITSGRIRYNAKATPYKKYEPYYSATYRYAEQTDEPSDVAMVLTHDALDRLIRIDMPLGVHTTLDRAAWSEVESDFSDTVRRSRYWHEHMVDGRPVGLDRFAGEALLKSALAADTPTTRSLDNLGRVIAQTVENNARAEVATFVALGLSEQQAEALLGILRQNGFLDFRDALTIAFQPEQPGFDLHLPAEYQPYAAGVLAVLDGLRSHGTPATSRFGFDAEDNQTLAVDPRLPALSAGSTANFRRDFALDRSAVRILAADAGLHYTLPDFRGMPILEVDGIGTRVRYTYDALGRLSTVVVRTPDGADTREWTSERWIYGDTLVADGLAATAANRNGRLWRVFDEAGLVEYDRYTLTGEAIIERRRFARDGATPDWTPQNATPTSPLLEATAYPLLKAYDALGRPRVLTLPGGERIETDYVLSGQVGSCTFVTAEGGRTPCVVSAAYTARSQPERVVYGNGVVGEYGYDPRTADLVAIRSSRTDDSVALQRLTIFRDVMGNITHLRDEAFGPLFGLLPGFDADSDQDYDALYRLVAARGIEHADRGAAADREGGYDGLLVPWSGNGVDPALFVPYGRSFAYDEGDNLYAVIHEAPQTSWFAQVVVSDRSNRAVEASIFDGSLGADPLQERIAPAADVDRFFDPNGNQTRLLGINRARWSYRNQIEALEIGIQQAVTWREQYAYDALHNRVRTIAATGNQQHEVVDVGPLRVERDLDADGTSVERRRRVRIVVESLLVAEYVVEAGTGDPAGRLTYYLGDPLRSIAFQLGEHGALLSYEAYLPYGPTAFAIAPDPPALDQKIERYSAQPRDRASGLAYYGARYLAPWSGRWTSPDPLGPVDGLNLYAFVGGNPTSAIDVGGTVKITLSDGTTIDVGGDEILTAFHVAADQLLAQSLLNPIASNLTTKSGLPIYVVAQRGQLFGLAYQQRGDPLTGVGVNSFRLNFGNLESTLKPATNEVGVHFGVTIGNAVYASDNKPEYHRLVPTTDPQAEAKRLIHLMKVKETPSTSSYNNTMIPIFTISETDRSHVGGLLNLAELYNVKYGSHTFDQAFVNNGNPYSVGAKTDGGAKALKHIDRERRKLPISKSQRMTKKQRTQLYASLETFLGHLARKRGKGRPGKFSGAKTKDEILNEVTRIMVKRAGYVVQQRQRRQAALTAARKIKVQTKGTS